MRVEQVKTVQNIPEKVTSAVMSEGDIIIAKVMEVAGDKVVLKNQEGGVLTAKLLTDIGVTAGDYVETVVEEAGGGRYVLRVVDIMQHDARSETAQPLREGQTAALTAMLAMLKMNPGASPKTAAFLAHHGLAGSAENIEAVASLARGDLPLGAVLSEIASRAQAAAEQTARSTANASQTAVARPEASDASQTAAARPEAANASQTVPESVRTPVVRPETGSPREVAARPEAANAVLPETQGQTTAGQPSQDGVVNGTAGTSQEMAMPGQSAASGDMPFVAPAASDAPVKSQPAPHGVFDAQTASADNAAQTTQAPAAQETVQDAVLPNSKAQKAVQTGEAVQTVQEHTAEKPAVPAQHSSQATAPSDEMAGPVQEDHYQVLSTLADKALVLLGRLDDAQQLAAHIRRAVEKTPEQLKELKSLINRTDITNKETLSAQLDQADKQAALLADVKRFDCYHIPLTNGRRETTAELYVFRRRARKSAAEADSIVILIGLDTAHMGRVETLVRAEGKAVKIEFHVEQEGAGDEIKADFAALDKAMSAAGYSLKGISVKPLAARTTVLNAEETLSKAVPDGAGNVDVRI